MFLSLHILRGHSAREPASIVCNDQQGGLFYSAGPQEKNSGGFGENAGEWTGRVVISEEEIPGCSAARMALYGRASGLKGEPLSCRVSTDGALISAFAEPYCGVLLGNS